MEYICDIDVSNDGVIVRCFYVHEEIIRCKDCKYMDSELDGAPICRRRCWYVGYDYDYVKLDFYEDLDK